MEGRATHTGQSHLFVRRCVCCGFESRALDDVAACVRCGCDLAERPPMSYAEMEGLLDPSQNALDTSGVESARWIDDLPPSIPLTGESEASRTIKRWMLFLLLSMLLLITIAALAAAALGG